MSEESSRKSERRGFVRRHGATGWYLMEGGRGRDEVSISDPQMGFQINTADG